MTINSYPQLDIIITIMHLNTRHQRLRSSYCMTINSYPQLDIISLSETGPS